LKHPAKIEEEARRDFKAYGEKKLYGIIAILKEH
jgi:hypothetical protein